MPSMQKESMPASFSNQLSLVIHYVRFIYFCLILALAIRILPLSRLSGWLGWNSIQLLKIVEKYWKYLKRCLWITANSSTPLPAPARPVLPETRGNFHFFTSEILTSVNTIWKINSLSFMEAFLHESLDSVLIANLTLWLLLAFDPNLPLLKINSECICFQVCFLLSLLFPSKFPDPLDWLYRTPDPPECSPWILCSAAGCKTLLSPPLIPVRPLNIIFPHCFMHSLKRPDSNKFKFLSWKKPWSEINRLKGKCNSHHSIPSLPVEHWARNFLSQLLNQTKFPQCTHTPHTQSQSPDTSRRIYSITKSPPLLQHKWHHLGTQPHLLRAPSSLLSRSDRSNKEPGLCSEEEKSIAAKSFPDKLIFSWEHDYRRIKDCSKKWAEQILVELINLHLWFTLNLYLVIPSEG